MADYIPSSNGRLTDDQLLKVLLRYRMSGDGSYVDTDVVAACIELRERRDADEPKAGLFDRAHQLIVDLHKEGMTTLQTFCNGSRLRIEPEQPRAAQPPRANPWDGPNGGSAIFANPDELHVSLRFELREDYEAMCDMLGLSETKGASND